MKTKNLFCILFINLLLGISPIHNYAQELIIEKEKFFNTIYDGQENSNPYYISKNPGYLYLEKSNQNLYINTLYNNNNGDFKTFLMPEQKRNYQLSFTGKKQISDDQIFRGTFAVKKEERDNWNWLTTKDYDIGSPFLLGDSTTGNSRYNSILMQTEYFHRLSQKFNMGISFTYGVDEGLKEVSPKPTSKHRDMEFVLGLTYLLNKSTSIGINFNLYDYNEELKYLEDEKNLYAETKLIKFKGLDFPILQSQKTDHRFSYRNSYSSGIHFSTKFSGITINTYLKGGFENISLKEGSTAEYPAGFWKQNFYNAKAHLLFPIEKAFKIGIYYQFNHTDSWAKHPDFDVILSENDKDEHSLSLGCRFSLSEKIKTALEFGTTYSKLSTDDYYSNVYWESKGFEYNSKISIDYKWTDILSTSIGYAFVNDNIYDDQINHAENSDYFLKYRIQDITYILSDYNTNKAFVKINISNLSIGEFTLYFTYSNRSAKDNSYFNGKNAEYMNINLEYNIAVY